jgi:hypothetical protein
MRHHCIAATLMSVGPRMTINSTVSFGGSAAAFFSFVHAHVAILLRHPAQALAALPLYS